MPVVASYAPELLELLKRASREKVEVVLENRSRGTRLAFQLNMLRKAMRDENHPLARMVAGVNISVSRSGVLTAGPADASFLTALRNAGIVVSELPLSEAPPLGGSGSEGEEVVPFPATPAEPIITGDAGLEAAQAALRAFLTDEPLQSETSNESEVNEQDQK